MKAKVIKIAKTELIPKYDPAFFHRLSYEFINASEELDKSSKGVFHFHNVKYFLACRALEIAMKSILIVHRWKKSQLTSFGRNGHDLEEIANALITKKYYKIDPEKIEMIKLISERYSVKDLEYNDFAGGKVAPNFKDFVKLTWKIIRDSNKIIQKAYRWKNKGVTLVGMPGSGKSILGKYLAVDRGLNFIDLDELIFSTTKMSPNDYMKKFGEHELLRLEEKLVLELDLKNILLAPGGSIVYSKKAMEKIKDETAVVFIDVSLNLLKDRVKNLDTRAIVGLRKHGLNKPFSKRKPLYEKYADLTLKNPSRSPKTLRNIRKFLASFSPLPK